MKAPRIVVAGGTGFFGGAVVDALRNDGREPVIASRRGPVRLDVEEAASIRATLQEGDVVVDCAGPFQSRSGTLARLADEVGFDVVDISDSLSYCERVLAVAPRRARLLTACSTVSAVTAALVGATGIRAPERVVALLVPEASASSRPGAARSMLGSLGRPIRALREGRLAAERGWAPSQPLDAGPLGRIVGRRMETADAVTLPRAFPSLREADLFVAVRPRWIGVGLGVAAACHLGGLLAWRPCLAVGLALARWSAPRGSAFVVRVEGEGPSRCAGLFADEGGHRVAALPAALAAEALSDGRIADTGAIPADRQVDRDLLLRRLADHGIRLERWATDRGSRRTPDRRP